MTTTADRIREIATALRIAQEALAAVKACEAELRAIAVEMDVECRNSGKSEPQTPYIAEPEWPAPPTGGHPVEWSD